MVHVGTQCDLDTRMLTLLDNVNTSRFVQKKYKILATEAQIASGSVTFI